VSRLIDGGGVKNHLAGAAVEADDGSSFYAFGGVVPNQVAEPSASLNIPIREWLHRLLSRLPSSFLRISLVVNGAANKMIRYFLFFC
jgi:hypothetical protein